MVFLVAKIGGGALSAMSARLSCFSSIEPLMRTWAWLDRVGMAEGDRSGRGQGLRQGLRARVRARVKAGCDLLQLLLGGLRSPAEFSLLGGEVGLALMVHLELIEGLLVVGEGLLKAHLVVRRA